MKRMIFAFIAITAISTISFAQKGNQWNKKNYTTSGDWSIDSEDGKTYLVLHSNFKTKKGPDLKLFLSKKTAQSTGKNEAVEKYGVFIGDLKSNKGSQKYLIPSNISINDFKSIIIHCEKYTKVWSATTI